MAKVSHTKRMVVPGYEKTRRFSVVSNNLPISHVLEVLDERLRLEGQQLRAGERRPVKRYATIKHVDGTHVILETANPIQLATVEGWFAPYRVRVKAIVAKTGRAREAWARMVRYLTHENEPYKPIYPDSAMHSSAGFDWHKEIDWVEGRDVGAAPLKDRIERRVMDGELTRWQVRESYPDLYRQNPRRWTMLAEDAVEHANHQKRHVNCEPGGRCQFNGGAECI